MGRSDWNPPPLVLHLVGKIRERYEAEPDAEMTKWEVRDRWLPGYQGNFIASAMSILVNEGYLTKMDWVGGRKDPRKPNGYRQKPYCKTSSVTADVAQPDLLGGPWAHPDTSDPLMDDAPDWLKDF